MDRMGGLEEFKNPSAMNNVIDSSAIKNLVLDKNINLKNEKNNNSKNNNEIQQKKLVKNNSLIYLTFALNDLIGADKTQKENNSVSVNEINKYLTKQKEYILKFLEILEKSTSFVDSIEKEIIKQTKDIIPNVHETEKSEEEESEEEEK